MRSLDLVAVTRLHRRRREKRAAYRNAGSSRVALGASLYLFSRSAHSTVNGESWDTVCSLETVFSLYRSRLRLESRCLGLGVGLAITALVPPLQKAVVGCSKRRRARPSCLSSCSYSYYVATPRHGNETARRSVATVTDRYKRRGSSEQWRRQLGGGGGGG